MVHLAICGLSTQSFKLTLGHAPVDFLNVEIIRSNCTGGNCLFSAANCLKPFVTNMYTASLCTNEFTKVFSARSEVRNRNASVLVQSSLLKSIELFLFQWLDCLSGANTKLIISY